jgi:Phosphotransferase enzyme family
MIAETFELGRPIEALVPHHFGSQQTWSLATMSGRFLVKRLWTGPDPAWRGELEQAMAFETRACQAGIDTAHPIVPPEPAFGCAVRVHGFGVFRVHEWLEHRPLGAADDVAEWLGTTLARLHQLQPLPSAPDPQWYGLFPPAQWQAWLAEGAAQGRTWAPLLRARLPYVAETSQWIAEAFAKAGGYIVTHRDVEPWNVLMTASGPRLVDWDTSGPDSATLEAAHSLLAFAAMERPAPDPDQVRRALAAYRSAGGAELRPGRDGIARRVGLRLHRLSVLLTASLGLVEPGPGESRQAETRACEQLEDLPDLVARFTAWSELFRR